MSQTIPVDAKSVVIITEDNGGFLAGECVACKAGGWLDPRYGYPHRVKGSVIGNRVIHKENCPMNEVFNDDGTFKS